MADTYTVERSTVIQAPAERIYDEVSDFHRWPDWSPWEDIDPEMERRHSGAESGVGAVYEWSGNRKAGEGRMEIIEARAPERVVIDLRFEKPFKSRSTTVFAFSTEGDTTHVVWTMTGPVTLMTRVMGLFTSMDKMVGPDFEKGLARLKQRTERAAT